MKIKIVLSLISLSLALTMIMGCGKSEGSSQTATISGDKQTGTGSQGDTNQNNTNSSDPNQTGTNGVITGETITSVSTGQTGTSSGTDQPPVVGGDGTNQTVAPNNVSLAWDMPTTYVDGTPLTDLAGFKVYYGTESGIYPQVIDVRDTTSYSSGALGPGTYYFAVTAYDSYRSESEFSNEISTTIL